MKKYGITLIIFLQISCNQNKKLEIVHIVSQTRPTSKIECFEIANYEYDSDKDLLDSIINYNKKTTNIDTIAKYTRYERYFYEKHFNVNYICHRNIYENEGRILDGVDDYLKIFSLYHKVEKNKIEISNVLYEKNKIKLEINDTINMYFK